MDFSFGLTKKMVEDISDAKQEPQWMRSMRLLAFDLYVQTPLPSWGPSLSGLDLASIRYFTPPTTQETDSWEDIPEEIKGVYESLGIRDAEKDYFGGVGAQYDSGMVYHRIKESLQKKGVIFENMDTAVQRYPELVQKYFMTSCVPAHDHKFTMLHAAVWSGGTFIYIPKGVDVGMPLQAYFRMNAQSSGQFEHTLIIADEGSSVSYIEGCSAPKYTSSSIHAGCVEVHVAKGARVQYSSIESWSKNTYNLNTKKALVYERGSIEWLNGNMGSAVTMLYPSSILLGEYAHSESLGITFAGQGQIQDTGTKVVHVAPHTTSISRSKSLSQHGGKSVYRGFVKIARGARAATAHVECDALIQGEGSESITLPTHVHIEPSSSITHEARVGTLEAESVAYIQTRGFTYDAAVRLLVGGFMNDVIRKLPLEYAVELNKMIDLEIKGM